MPSFKQSLSFAANGIKVFWEEKHMKIHSIMAFLVIVSGLFFRITLTEWLICIILIALVLSLEIINTAIENLVNLVSPDYHPLAGKVKDLAAGAVLVAAIAAFVCGSLIFGKYIIALF